VTDKFPLPEFIIVLFIRLYLEEVLYLLQVTLQISLCFWVKKNLPKKKWHKKYGKKKFVKKNKAKKNLQKK
jgi:hypothetical protein